ncbi:MAG: response regulator, partial [Gemmatimonadaceae bacterium]|nr:response regulator [Gemmatimonadaceae bacterium]
LAREMVEQHGGTLAIESSVGRGTTVRLVLPPVGGAEAPTGGPSRREPRVVRREAMEEPPNAVILLVDDEPRVLDAFSRALGELGQVIAVPNGREALAAIDQGARPDVLVCDLMMPGMGGIELRERLMARGPVAASRMLFITGGAVTDETRAFVEREDVQVLFKPVTAREMREAVRAMLASEPDRR